MADEERAVEDRLLEAITGESEVEEVEEQEEPEAEEVEVEEVAEEVAADPEQEVVEIEIDGELVEVPVKYKDHFLRQKDYTVKTQEVAAQRKAVEVQMGAVEQARQQYDFAQSVQPSILKAQQLEAQAEQYHEHLRSNIDSLSATDITKIQMAIQDARNERDGIINDVKAQQTEFQQAQEQSRTELLNKGTEVLRQRIPGWGETQQKQVREYAISTGFTEAEISQVTDPRQVEALYKASQYDALKSGVVPAVKAVQTAIKPSPRNKMDQEAKDRLAINKIKKSNLSDAKKADALMDKIGDRFS